MYKMNKKEVEHHRREIKKILDEVYIIAKHEMICDIDNLKLPIPSTDYLIGIIEGVKKVKEFLIKRHLSTFQKKSDIIADKSKSANLHNTNNNVAD